MGTVKAVPDDVYGNYFKHLGVHTMVSNTEANYKVAIVGVGGAGCNIVNQLYGSDCPVDTIAINTDKTDLHATRAGQKIYICKEVLHGEGTKGDTKIGKKCADIHKEEIREALSRYNMVIVVSGLGGGTGTGATPVVVEAAQSQNILTFAITVKPFFFEGDRTLVANEGYTRIKGICPHAMAVANDSMIGNMASMKLDDAFKAMNDVIIDHIKACMENYSNVTSEDDEEKFESFVRNSPLYAYTSA